MSFEVKLRRVVYSRQSLDPDMSWQQSDGERSEHAIPPPSGARL